MKQNFYIVGDYFKTDDNLITDVSVSGFTLEYIKDYVSDIAELAKQGRAILGIATISDETKEAFIESVKTAGIPEELRDLNIEINWPYDNDYAEFMEEGCKKYGLTMEELEELKQD